MSRVLHIGIDDTDSLRMGCTTYVAALLVDRLSQMGATFPDFPNLIRLNPNIPWKTRGNGALCLRIEHSDQASIKDTVIETVEQNSDIASRGTDPGIVFYEGRAIPKELQDYARNTIQDVTSLKAAMALVKRFKAEAVGYNSGRGIVGALAAIGETLKDDYTYELITYRSPQNRGKSRRVNTNSILRMDKETKGLTFNNVDPESGRILITPRGPDPVLYGIRGESPEAVKMAAGMVMVEEEVERWVIFKTNQGTDAHLRSVDRIDAIHPYHPVIVRGKVVGEPRTIPLRHVIMTIEDCTGRVDCAAYEPTGSFRNIVRSLRAGDFVEAYGGVRLASTSHPQTVNLEKLRVLSLSAETVYKNPYCPKCRRIMESMGRNKGFRCRKCDYRDSRAERVPTTIPRKLSLGLYITPPGANRHLTKPMSRYGFEKVETLDLNAIIPKDFWGMSSPPVRLDAISPPVQSSKTLTNHHKPS